MFYVLFFIAIFFHTLAMKLIIMRCQQTNKFSVSLSLLVYNTHCVCVYDARLMLMCICVCYTLCALW